MIKMELRNILAAMAPALLGEHWNKYGDNNCKKAVKFVFDCSFYTVKNFEGNRFSLAVIVTQSHEVFWAKGDHNSIRSQKEDFTFYSDHDSCWRGLDFLTQIYFEACQSVDKKLAPINISQHIDFALSSNPVSVIDVEISRVAQVDYNLSKRLRIL